MKYKTLLIILICSHLIAHKTLATEHHSASDVKLTQQKLKKQSYSEVKLFFDDYLKYYNAIIENPNNQDALVASAENYHSPAIQIIPNIPLRMVHEKQKLMNGSRAFLLSLKEKGVTTIEWENIQIKMLSENSAIASNIGVRYLSDGKIHNKAAATYLLKKSKSNSNSSTNSKSNWK